MRGQWDSVSKNTMIYLGDNKETVLTIEHMRDKAENSSRDQTATGPEGWA